MSFKDLPGMKMGFISRMQDITEDSSKNKNSNKINVIRLKN